MLVNFTSEQVKCVLIKNLMILGEIQIKIRIDRSGEGWIMNILKTADYFSCEMHNLLDL